jgi:uncharacterized protein
MIDKSRFGTKFGPWALVTGASSGIGRELAEQIAAFGIHLALVARRGSVLQEVGLACAKKFAVQYRVIAADLSANGFMADLARATDDLDIGLVISNAGTANPGRFLAKDSGELGETLRLSALAHAEIARHFGERLVARGRGGMMFVGAMGAPNGAPFMAHDAGAKAYVQSFALGLHEELKRSGVHVTALCPGPTDTPVLARFNLDPKTMPMKPLPARQAASEGLEGLVVNRAVVVPGRMNRIMSAIVPPSVTRAMMMRMFSNMAGLSSPKA